MMMTTRKKSVFAVLAVGLIAALGGVAVAHDGFGAGDGTGPIGVEPQDGTGLQHRSPPTTLTVVVDETATPAGDAAQVREQEQAQLREQDRIQLREQDQAQACDQDELQIRERDQQRMHDPAEDSFQDRDRIQACQ